MHRYAAVQEKRRATMRHGDSDVCHEKNVGRNTQDAKRCVKVKKVLWHRKRKQRAKQGGKRGESLSSELDELLNERGLRRIEIRSA